MGSFVEWLTAYLIFNSPVLNSQLKNRILGAILLMVFAVVLIPLFLGAPRSNIAARKQQQQAAEQGQFQSKIQPLPTADLGIAPSLVEAESTKSVPVNSSNLVAKKIPVSPNTAVGIENSTVKKPISEATKWALQAGVFIKQENTAAFIKKLSQHGFKPNSTPTQISSGAATRVWLGPFDSRIQAQQRATKLQLIIKEGSYIAPYPFK